MQTGTPVGTISAALHSDRGAAERGAHALLCHVLSASQAAANVSRPRRPSEEDDSAALPPPDSGSGMLRSGEDADVELLRSFRTDRLVCTSICACAGWT